MSIGHMKTSQNGIDLIKKFEGCRLTAYKDIVGVWTIGYGHTNGVTQGMKISQDQADIFLRSDVANSEKYVNQYDAIYHFTQNQYDALVSFTYNCGAGNLKKLVNGGQRTIAEISNAIPNYNKGGGKVLNGLVKRRADEKAMFDRSTPKKPISDVVDEVIAGKWSSGNDRRQRLTKAGYNYNEVQAEVNKRLKK